MIVFAAALLMQAATPAVEALSRQAAAARDDKRPAEALQESAQD
jgi:hypothetical protein